MPASFFSGSLANHRSQHLPLRLLIGHLSALRKQTRQGRGAHFPPPAPSPAQGRNERLAEVHGRSAQSARSPLRPRQFPAWLSSRFALALAPSTFSPTSFPNFWRFLVYRTLVVFLFPRVCRVLSGSSWVLPAVLARPSLKSGPVPSLKMRRRVSFSFFIARSSPVSPFRSFPPDSRILLLFSASFYCFIK